MAVCDIRAFGTVYSRPEDPSSEVAIAADSTDTLTIDHIAAETLIGNTLAINMR